MTIMTTLKNQKAGKPLKNTSVLSANDNWGLLSKKGLSQLQDKVNLYYSDIIRLVAAK